MKIFGIARKLILTVTAICFIFVIAHKVISFYLVYPQERLIYHVKIANIMISNQIRLQKIPDLIFSDYIKQKELHILSMINQYTTQVHYLSITQTNDPTDKLKNDNLVIGLAKVYPQIFAYQIFVFMIKMVPFIIMGSLIVSGIVLYPKYKHLFLKEKKDSLKITCDYSLQLKMPVAESVFKKTDLGTPVSRLFLQIYSAFRDWPASINDHQSYSGGLVDHIQGVIQYLESHLDLIKSKYPNLSMGFVVDACIGHDLGKTLVYYKNGDSWSSYATHHDKTGGLIIRSLKSEITKHYNYEEYDALYYAVSYHHSPHDMPVSVPVFVTDVIKIINDADKYAIDTHINKAREIVINNKKIFTDVFINVCDTLNINAWKGGQADGFYIPADGESPGVVLLFWVNVREKIISSLPKHIQEYFKYKKAAYAVLPVLHKELKNVFYETFEGRKVSAFGTFTLLDRKDVVIVSEDVFSPDIKRNWMLGRTISRQILKKPGPSNEEHTAIMPEDEQEELKQKETVMNK